MVMNEMYSYDGYNIQDFNMIEKIKNLFRSKDVIELTEEVGPLVGIDGGSSGHDRTPDLYLAVNNKIDDYIFSNEFPFVDEYGQQKVMYHYLCSESDEIKMVIRDA